MKKLQKILSNERNKIIFFFVLFIFSRIFFVNTQGVFFDSKEYLNLLSNPNYITAIISGHFPPHEGYIILFWPIFHLIQFFHGNGAYGVILLQIILSFITLLCFYEVIKYLTDKAVATYATIIASLTPLFWIINVTLMMENAYTLYFFISLYLLILYLKKNKTIYLHVSLIFYSFALITIAMVGLWAPVYLFIVYLKNKKEIVQVLLLLFLYFFAFSAGNILFISAAGHSSLQSVFYNYYFSKVHEFATLPLVTHSILVAGRNFLIPLLRNNTILLILLSLLSLLLLFKKNVKLFFFGTLWILPAIYTNQWWDSLLNGRHAVLTGFGIAFLVAFLIRKPIIFSILIIYLLICSVPALNLLRYPIPYLQEADYVKHLPKNTLLIESHFARPQVQDTAKGKTLYVNEPSWSKETFIKTVNTYLREKKPAFISGAALTEPYGLFSGPYLHNISLSYRSPYELQSVIPHYTLKKYKVINSQDNLIIYQIVSISKTSSPYPPLKHLQNSYRRIDYTDPLSLLVRRIETTFSHQ